MIFNSRYSFYIDIGNGYQQAYPDLVEKFKISREAGSDDIEKYFYRILWGKIHFSNSPLDYANTNNPVYALFDYIQSVEFPYDKKILVKVVAPQLTVFGYFGKNDCTFDFDRKILTVEPSVEDKYTNILENWENSVDFKNYPYDNTVVRVPISDSLLVTINDWPHPSGIGTTPTLISPRNRIKETDYDNAGELYLYFDGNGPKEQLFDDPYYGFAGGHKIYSLSIDGYTTYSLADRIQILGQTPTVENALTLPVEYGDFELSKFRVYEGTRIGGLSGNRWRQLYCHTWFSREETIKIDVVDIENPYGFESPVGEGWHMRITRIKNGKNAHLWTRKPFDGAYSETWSIPVMVNDDGTKFEWSWYKYLESSLQYDDSANSIEIKSTIGLREYVQSVIRKSHSSLQNVQFKSTFFFNDFEEELEVLKKSSGYNYVTGKKNHLNRSRVFFTKDLKELDDKEKKNNPTTTLKDVLNDLHQLFVQTLTWFIDDNGYFRIEHIRYFDLKKVPLDISNDKMLSFTTYWNYDKSKMFERYECTQINGGYPDFIDNLVTYNKIVSNNRNQDLKKTISTKIFSTDAKYCILNPNDLKDGLVFVALDSNNVVINKVCSISNQEETNGAVALSSILHDFATYEGMWHVGAINNKTAYFTTTFRNKLGVELKLRGIKLSLTYATQIGVGLIDEGTIDLDSENTALTLRYRYNSSVNGDVFALVFQKQSDFNGAQNTWADIDNYIIIT